MVVILLEALLALTLLVLIVWWTMFSGRNNGELPDAPPARTHADPASPAPAAGDDDNTHAPPH